MTPELFRIVFPVPDLARADAFYSSLLGLPVDSSVPHRHYIHTGGAILALVDPLEYAGPPRPPLPDWSYFRVPELDEFHERARTLGAASDLHEGPDIVMRPWGERSFYVRDPFGNGLCFIDDVGSEPTAGTHAYGGKPIATLCKVILPAASLGRSTAFFETLLELDVDTAVPNRHFLYCDACMLALVDPVEHATQHGLGDVTFRPNPDCIYLAVDELDAAFERAGKLSMGPFEVDQVGLGISVRPWGERSFYGVDPSGNPICLVERGTCFRGAAGGSG